MPAIKFEQFGGMLPAWNDHYLPAGQAALSVNGYLFSGALRGWREPKVLRALNNSTAAFVYRVPTVSQSKAGASLVFIDNPAEGDTVKIGEETYTFTATVTNPYDVLIGATAADSAANLFAAVTLGLGIGTIYGTGTCLNPAISTVAGENIVDIVTISAAPYTRLFIRAPDVGAAFNTTTVTESTGDVRLTWLSSLDFSATTPTYTGGTNPTFDNRITGTAKWLEFLDPDTSVMRSPVVDDKFGRYYFSSPSLPPKYNTYDRIQADQPAWLLGVPPPGCPPIVSVTGGGDATQTGNPTSTSGATFAPGPNTLYLVKITSSAAQQLDDVAFMPAATDASAKFAAVLYDDNGGEPFQLMNIGNIVTGCVADTQVTSQFLNPTPLLADVDYWIGFMTDSNVAIHNADATTSGVTFSNTFSNGPPAFAGTPTTGQPTLHMWGDMTTSAVLAARSYVYTFVTEYNEEGPPSPFTLVNGWGNATWQIDTYSPPPDDMGVQRNITKKRIYRTITGSSGVATYFFVAEIPVTQLTYIDTVDDSIVALNNELTSTTWFPPPEGLSDIQAMPNGLAVGFRGNEVWFCEPYQPHAWPPNYVITTEFPIVGLGVSGQSVIAATNSTPYIATGINPAQMTLTKIHIKEPCISRGSVLSTDSGVYYASPNGLILVNQLGSATNTTELWITRERWRELTPPKNLRAVHLVSSYFAFGSVAGTDNSVAQDGFTIELSAGDAQSFTIWPQPGGHRIGFSKLAAPFATDIKNVQVDPWSGTGLLIQGGNVLYYDFADQASVMQTYKWRSKIYHQTARKNFEVCRVFFQTPPGTPTQSATRNTAPTDDPSWNALAPGQYAIIRFFADENLVTAREVRTSGELLRILSGFKYERWQVEIEARVPIHDMQMATTLKELGQV